MIASARDERLHEIYPREWDRAYIGLPKVNKREQHRPTFTAKEISFIVANARRPLYKALFALLAGSGLRIGEILALEIGKHVSADCSVIYVRQQRDRWGRIQLTPKTEAGLRDVDLDPKLADLLHCVAGPAPLKSLPEFPESVCQNFRNLQLSATAHFESFFESC